MIPTLILFGLVFGRWWRSALAVTAIGWPALLVATSTLGVEPRLLIATGFALLNTGVGVLIHQGVWWLFRNLRNQGRAPVTPTRD
ncbi:hypothetical protein QQG74_25815 [Micromonospora sp. FIMYZ51]|uniref:hypothetical protein n=1 Tax=Micromonospora sp. FIMYZ51 TaxID=3051832 RepID=UPI00311E0E7E